MASSSSVMSLRNAVEEVIQPQKNGCRIVGGQTNCIVYVFDLYKWTHQNMVALQYLFPGAQVSIEGSCQSLSGFKVVIREEPPPPENLNFRLWIVAIGSLLFTVLLCQGWTFASWK